jgi:GNAT superfamily N-acetyltransferase
MEFQIRPAEAPDFPAIHGLILALAEFERAPTEVDVTPESLLADWNAGRFHAWVAVADGGIRGMALGFWRYSTWKGPTYHLEDLIVDAPFRGAGMGRALLHTLAQFALAQGAHRLHWEVLDWNTPAVEFYQSLGAEIASHWWPCRMDRQAMEHFAHG